MCGRSRKNCYFESNEKSTDKISPIIQKGKRFFSMIEMTMTSSSDGHVLWAFFVNVTNETLNTRLGHCFIFKGLPFPWIQLVSATVSDMVVPKNTSCGV